MREEEGGEGKTRQGEGEGQEGDTCSTYQQEWASLSCQGLMGRTKVKWVEMGEEEGGWGGEGSGKATGREDRGKDKRGMRGGRVEVGEGSLYAGR